MPPHIAAAAARCRRITRLVCSAGQKLSVRIHVAADARAWTLGWMVTEIPRAARPARSQLPRPAVRRAPERQDAQPRKGRTP